MTCSGGAVHDADQDQGEDEGVRPAVRKIAQPFSRIFSYIIIVAHFLVHHSRVFSVLCHNSWVKAFFYLLIRNSLKARKCVFF